MRNMNKGWILQMYLHLDGFRRLDLVEQWWPSTGTRSCFKSDIHFRVALIKSLCKCSWLSSNFQSCSIVLLVSSTALLKYTTVTQFEILLKNSSIDLLTGRKSCCFALTFKTHLKFSVSHPKANTRLYRHGGSLFSILFVTSRNVFTSLSLLNRK